MNDLLLQIKTLDKFNDSKGIYDLVEKQLRQGSDDVNLWISLAIAIILE